MNFDNTVDPREVKYYKELAETWWDKSGPFWPLHQLNMLRVTYIKNALCLHFDRDPESTKPLDGLRVLDVGCGGGILSESIAKLGAQVTGIDVVEKNIEVARLHASQSELSIDYRLTPASELADQQERFDVVLNMEVAEHVADLGEFMADCCRVTGSRGIMFVSTINRTPLAWLVAIIGAEYVLGWLPRGTHHWRLLRKPAEIRQCLAEGGLRLRDIVGVTANPLTRKLKIISSVQVNYMLYATRAKR
ncbi:MAG TPA: bifunctional 2-polyprenyl-6-hydroxyphenol methylase/3-demethylubiquinol 3-O-methyltransferase UbiG [Xanthomonadales bacterium]|nr:bifunctional 2-polyprenyl-6-hydroxyphenol methylase/3-demethylubiquinol 3-O-methyltransferase UbiG [Xanthomonadales bacterium]